MFRVKTKKSQHKNKDKAMKILRSRIYDVMEEQRHKEITDERKSQVAAVTEVNVSEHTTFLKAELPITELILHYINLNKYLTVILMKLLMHLLRLTKPQNLQVRMIKEI